MLDKSTLLKWETAHLYCRALWVDHQKNGTRVEEEFDGGPGYPQRHFTLPFPTGSSGQHSREIMRFLKFLHERTQSPYDRRNLTSLLEWVWSTTLPATFPCHLTCGKTYLGLGLSWSQYLDLIAFGSLFQNYEICYAYGPVTMGESLYHYRSIVAEYAGEVQKGDPERAVVPVCRPARRGATQQQLLQDIRAVVIPMRTVEECIAPLLRDMPAGFWGDIVIDDVPVTPDGAWLKYLDALLHPTPVVVAAPEVPALPVAKPQAVEKPKKVFPVSSTPALLAGMDGQTLLEEVLTNPLGHYVCELEGPVSITPEFKRQLRQTPGLETCRPLHGQEVVAAKLAVMEWNTFISTFDNRRHPARRLQEALLGREINFTKANVVDIAPGLIGELPAIVAGLYRNYPDRLCVARVVYRTGFRILTPEERSKRRPLLVKSQYMKGTTQVRRQNLTYVEPRMLAVFPAAWMRPVAEPWMPGLFGTPHDPALLDFCKEMPEEWWEGLRKLIPPKNPGGDMLDVRAQVTGHFAN